MFDVVFSQKNTLFLGKSELNGKLNLVMKWLQKKKTNEDMIKYLNNNNKNNIHYLIEFNFTNHFNKQKKYSRRNQLMCSWAEMKKQKSIFIDCFLSAFISLFELMYDYNRLNI